MSRAALCEPASRWTLLSFGVSLQLATGWQGATAFEENPNLSALKTSQPGVRVAPLTETDTAQTAPDRRVYAEATGLADQDNRDLFTALYNLKAEGWTGTPLEIVPIVVGKLPGNSVNMISSAPAQSHPALSLMRNSDNETDNLISEFGAVEYGQRTFNQGQHRIIVKAFRFATPDGAYGAYLSLRRGSSTTLLKGDATSQDDKSISIWRDKYFLSLATTEDDDELTMSVITGFANQLAAAIKTSSSAPVILSHLPLQGRVRGSEKLIYGPLAMKRWFSAPEVSSLCKEINPRSRGALADYQTQEPYHERLRLMFLQFASVESANIAYTGYLAALEQHHTALPSGSSLPQSSLFKISGMFSLVELRGPDLVVITGARKKLSAALLARSVY
jgi:hypothetical protein